MEMLKIGEVNFKEFTTQFYATPRVQDYLESNDISFTYLLPSGWDWYESTLFDAIDLDEDGQPDAEFGTKFKAIFTGIAQGREVEEEEIHDAGFDEELDLDTEIVLRGTHSLGNDFLVRYSVIKE